MNRSPKLLKCTLTMGSAITTSSWNAVISGIVSQTHNAYTDPSTGRKYYNGYDVAEGDYITTISSGKCLKITNISSLTDVSFNCVLVDEAEINRSIDVAGDGRVSNGEGYIFEIKDGVPALFPLPSGLAAGFNFTFASQLLSRFVSLGGGVGGSVPENVLTTDDIGVLVPNLTTGKVPVAQLPVGVNSLTQVAPGGDYLLSSARGVSVAPLTDGKIPLTYIPTIQDQYETVTTYNDLLNLATKSTSVYYIVSSENAIYKWTGTVFIRVSGDSATETSYSYISVTQSNVTHQALNKQVISVVGNNVTISLLASPQNGNEIIILNTGSGTIIDPGEYTIRNINGPYNLPDSAYSTYLVYVNGWQFSESSQLINVYTQQPGVDQFGPSDYWPAGTYQSMTESTIYGKEAYIEAWDSTRTSLVTILQYSVGLSGGSGRTIVGTTPDTTGWTVRNVDLGIVGDKITIAGATGVAANLNGTWEVTELITDSTTQFAFVIDNEISQVSPMTTGIGNCTRTIKEHLAEQVTIFETGTDNFRSIWFPKNGVPLQRDVSFDISLMPVIKYSNNLVLNMCKLMYLDWRNYETFGDLVSDSTNFYSILDNQSLLDTIASNSDFINEFINCRSDRHYENPIMTGASVPTGNSVGTSSTLTGTQAYYAFDASLDTSWQSNNLVTNQYLYVLLNQQTVNLFPYSFTIYTKTPGFSPNNFRLEYRNALNEWVTVGNYKLSNDTIEDTFYVFKSGIASYGWRFFFEDCYSTEKMIVNNIKIRGWNIYGM